jgi:hypothetical protein
MKRFAILLDQPTAEWVTQIANLLHVPPETVIASIVKDVALDDVEAHISEHHNERRSLQ